MSLESVFKLSLIMNMIDNLSGPMAGVVGEAEESMKKLDKINEMFGGMTKAGAVMQEVGTQMTQAVLEPVQATFGTSRALSELSSLGVEDLETLESAAESFSNRFAGTTKSDFITAAYDIKSGIASLTDEGVAQYTELAGITAKATKSTTGEMTSLFASAYGIYKDYYSDMSDLEFGEMFSSGLAKSVAQFKTSGSGMAQGIQMLGASATNAMIPMEEQMAILGMLQATMSGSEAGTKYKAFLRSAVKGGEALGMSFMDSNNQMMSLGGILEMLHVRFGETIDAAEKMEIQKAFGDSESIAFLDMFYNKVGALRENIDVVGESMNGSTNAAMEMAEIINQSAPDKFEVIGQKVQNIKEAIGNTLLPTISELMDRGSDVLNKIGEWVGKNQELVGTIMKIALIVGVVVTVLGSFLVVVGTTGMMITRTIGVFKMLKAGFLLAQAGLTPLIASVWSFTAALLANPITWVVIGIVALVAILVLLYNKCEWFRNGVNAILDFLKEKFGAAVETLKKVFTAVGNVVKTVLTQTLGDAKNTLSNMKAAYEEHGGGIKGVVAAMMESVKGNFRAGFNYIDTLTGGKLSALKDKAASKLEGLKDAFGDAMEASKNKLGEGLLSMQTAFNANGGGLKGAAAATMEGVKTAFDTGYTFLNTLTGGKLAELQGKFSEGVAAIKNGVSEKISSIGEVFSQALESIKTRISEAINWFFTSGQKVATTFADGIRSAISSAVEAVQGGLQNIRNMLPFSDAKEGPLSTLTLSGQRTMTTYAEGLTQAQSAPALAMEQGLEQTRATLEREPPSRVSFTSSDSYEDEQDADERGGSKSGVHIAKLLLNVDFSKIKELPLLIKLLEEIQDYTHANGGEVDPTAAPEPA